MSILLAKHLPTMSTWPFSLIELIIGVIAVSVLLGLLKARLKCLAIFLRNNRLCGRPFINIPPGSLGLPLIGESMQFISSYRCHRYPDTFIKKRCLRYGRIFTTHLFGKPTVVSLDAEVNRFILNSNGRLFVPDYPTSLKELWGKWAILMQEGSLHKKLHGIVAALLKSEDLKDHLLHHIEAFILDAMESWSGSNTIHVEEETKKISFYVTAKVILGLDPGPTTTAFRLEFHKFIAGVVSMPIKLPGTTFYKSLQSRGRMVEMIEEIIREREKGLQGQEEIKDILGVLMKMKGEEEKMPLEVITDNIVSFFFPAEDSVAMLMTLAVKYLSECPKALLQLKEENLSLLERNKGRKLSWRHYSMQLPFTHSVLSETLRLGNIVKGVIRRALVDVHIKGFVIPKGWNVFPFFRGVHLDDAIYPDAQKFNPWRWQEKISLSHYTPFGGGPRYCTGVEIARLEAVVFLHHLVTKYEWELAEKDTVTNFPFVKLAKRLPIKILSTSNQHRAYRVPNNIQNGI